MTMKGSVEMFNISFLDYFKVRKSRKAYSTRCLFEKNVRDLVLLPDAAKVRDITVNVYRNIQCVSEELGIKYYKLENFKITIEYAVRYSIEAYIEVTSTRNRKQLDQIYNSDSRVQNLGKFVKIDNGGFYTYARSSYQKIDQEEFQTGLNLGARQTDRQRSLSRRNSLVDRMKNDENCRLCHGTKKYFCGSCNQTGKIVCTRCGGERTDPEL